MKCTFCDADVKTLHKRSHIVPEWMYKHIYDNKHRLNAYRLDARTEQTIFKGYYKSFICEKCEEMFSFDDDYAAKAFTKRVPGLTTTTFYSGRVFSIEGWQGFDFKKIQKFVLGVVIRNYLALKDSQKVPLGVVTYEKIKGLYQDERMIDDSIFPIQVARFVNPPYQWPVILPFVANGAKGKACLFMGGGFFFTIFLEKGTVPRSIENYKIKNNGYMNVCCLPFEQTGIFKRTFEVIREIKRQ